MACESFSYRVIFVSRVFNASSKTRDNLFVSFSVSEGLETVFSERKLLRYQNSSILIYRINILARVSFFFSILRFRDPIYFVNSIKYIYM